MYGNAYRKLTLTVGLLVCGASALGSSSSARAQVRPVGPSGVAASSALYSGLELQGIVGPIALYPDDLLGIVLAASAYPLQIVEAARFVGANENARLEPNPRWDESVVALLNYPEVLMLMSDDLEWTAELGDALVDQQDEVLDAVQRFRARAYAAGNLRSDEHQVVRNRGGFIEISSVDPRLIYVPHYEPELVVVAHRAPAYFYYPRPYPIYDFPYPAGYAFTGVFWGVTTAFVVRWRSHALHVYCYGERGHPYFGHRYHTAFYARHAVDVYVNRAGSVWRPSPRRFSSPRRFRVRHPAAGSRELGGERHTPRVVAGERRRRDTARLESNHVRAPDPAMRRSRETRRRPLGDVPSSIGRVGRPSAMGGVGGSHEPTTRGRRQPVEAAGRGRPRASSSRAAPTRAGRVSRQSNAGNSRRPGAAGRHFARQPGRVSGQRAPRADSGRARSSARGRVRAGRAQVLQRSRR
jgi:hypothetical protein